MSTARKYLFDNDFAHPEEIAKRRPVHTEDEMAAAKAEAFAAGQAAAEGESRASEEQRIAELLDAIAAKAAALHGERAEIESRAAREASELAITICRKMLPTLTAQNALTEIEGLVTRSIVEMNEEPRLVVRVSDAKLDALQERFERMSATFPGKLVLLGDDELADTDCAVLWADGGAERDLGRLWGELDAVLPIISDAQTRPESHSPMEELSELEARVSDLDHTTADAAAQEFPPDAASAASAMQPHEALTDTAKQESGHG